MKLREGEYIFLVLLVLTTKQMGDIAYFQEVYDTNTTGGSDFCLTEEYFSTNAEKYKETLRSRERLLILQEGHRLDKVGFKH